MISTIRDRILGKYRKIVPIKIKAKYNFKHTPIALLPSYNKPYFKQYKDRANKNRPFINIYSHIHYYENIKNKCIEYYKDGDEFTTKYDIKCRVKEMK